jgi:hypothetical protein
MTSWAHVWKLRFSFFELGYDRVVVVQNFGKWQRGEHGWKLGFRSHFSGILVPRTPIYRDFGLKS